MAWQHMPTVEKFGADVAEKTRSLRAATVIAPAPGGLVLGREVARPWGIRFIFVEKEEGKLALQRGFEIAKGEPMA